MAAEDCPMRCCFTVHGMGKLHFAKLLGQSLCCAHPAPHGEPCQECSSCLTYRAGSHPDMREVAPEEPGKVIRIDQARALCNFMALTSAGYKVGIIAPAHKNERGRRQQPAEDVGGATAAFVPGAG